MKKLVFVSFISALSLSLGSCEKCATCTSPEDDPNATQDERTTEICGRGRSYSDQLTVYERTDWECTEN